MMRLVLWCMVWAASGASLWAEMKPKVYNNVSKGEVESAVEKAIVAQFSKKYEIVTFEESAAYVKPAVTGGSLPDTARTPSGEMLSGSVMVGYVVTLEGRAVDAFVVETTDERLNAIALAATEGWRFQPAKLDGIPIPTMAGQSFEFKKELVRKAPEEFAVTLYQPDSVLTDRVPELKSFADYIKQLQALVVEFEKRDGGTAKGLVVVVAVRPGRQSRVWLMPSRTDDAKLAAFRDRLVAVRPLEVQGGPVVFALHLRDDKDDEGVRGGTFQPPFPEEWSAAIKDKQEPLGIDDMLEMVWPQTRAGGAK